MIEFVKTKLIKHIPTRLFTFGCSFTKYYWTTWPEIIAADLNIDLYNLGQSGAGNEFMFNMLMQVDKEYCLNENDLVIICWTNICREDRCTPQGWDTPGNIYTQDEYPIEFVKKYYSDPMRVGVHDHAYIKASRSLLDLKKCQWHFLQMMEIDYYFDQWRPFKSKVPNLNKLFSQEKKFIKPSFYEILWNNNISKNRDKELERYKFYDGHPSPLEHFVYLSSIFEHSWKDSIISKLQIVQTEYEQLREKNAANLKNLPFKHLHNTLQCANIF